MKRFGVWTLVFLIAIVDFGYIRPGFAQAEEDDSISGASGQSVRTNVVWGASWTWTAPATGPVTFDTHGSDFDTLLTIFDGATYDAPIASNVDLSDGTFSSEVRFTAQQGQTYSITAIRAGISFDPGTIVLNWQASSVGGGSRVSADDFGSSTAVSGASGRSKGSSLGAGKESGEPDHAGNSGGASVWWTWTAPATGSVTFDTRGSNFDTLLAVYAGNSLGSLVEVASNDDASDGTLQSEVHFSAQQGQTYHLAVDGYGGKSGTVVLNWQASSSGVGRSGDDDFSLRVSLSGASGRSEGSNVDAGIQSGEPNHAGNSGGASVWWTWTAPATGPVTFDTRGSNFDTLLAVYAGDSLGRLTEVASNDDDADGWTLGSAVRFNAQQGQTYHIVVDGYGGATGAIVMNWRTAASGGDGEAPPSPDLGMISLSGTVREHSTGAGIAGATVSVTQYSDDVPYDLGTTTTNDEGAYAIQVDADPGRVNVKVEAEHFAPQSVIVNRMEGMNSANADLTMVPIDVTQSFQPTQDTEIMKGDQVLVEVPANSLMTASGSAPAGNVMAMVTNLDASSDSATMPGDFMSADGSTGTSGPIESFGAMNMMFTDENGEPLNLSSGEEAIVSIPLAGRRDPQGAPETIPLFYWSDERGQWIEEGEATLEEVDPGRWAYIGRVSHFSTWNADKRYETIRLRGCVKDSDGNPAAFVRVTAQGRDYIGSSSATTDADGWFDIPVRRDSEVLLSAVGGVHRDSLALSTGSASRTLNTCLTLMPAICASYVPGTIPDRIVVSETTHMGPEGLTASGLNVDNAVINWRWIVTPIREPAPPGKLDPNNGIFVAAKAVDIKGSDGLTALGYTIRVANPPDVTGLDQGWNYRRNSDGAKDGHQIYVRGKHISVEYWNNGVRQSTASYDNGKPNGWFHSYVNGEKEGVQYYILRDNDDHWSFNTRCAGTLHGPTGDYDNGKPNGWFHSYVNGEKEGVQHYILRDDNDVWDFVTRSAGTLHGPTGDYDNGKPNGWFHNYVNGEKGGVQHYILRDDNDVWDFVTRSAGTLHGPTGDYDNGKPNGWFHNYVNGEKEGVQHYILRDDNDVWDFVTRSAGTLHGPTGDYDNGLRNGWFGSYTNGNRSGTWTYYSNGKASDTKRY